MSCKAFRKIPGTMFASLAISNVTFMHNKKNKGQGCQFRTLIQVVKSSLFLPFSSFSLFWMLQLILFGVVVFVKTYNYHIFSLVDCAFGYKSTKHKVSTCKIALVC